MQNYDEAYFREKANRGAGTIWLILMVIVSIYYGVKMSQGEVATEWFVLFSIIGWGTYLGAGISLKIKGMDFVYYKNVNLCAVVL